MLDDDVVEFNVDGKTVQVDRLERGRIGDSTDIFEETRGGVDVTTAGSSGGLDDSLGMDFLRQGVGSCSMGAALFVVEEEVEEVEEDNWNVEVDRTEWPLFSPDKTKFPDFAVGKLTLDVCITGDGSTSMDNLRGRILEFEEEEDDGPVIFTSCTLLYWNWAVTPLLRRRPSADDAGISATTTEELWTGFNWISMLDSMLALRF